LPELRRLLNAKIAGQGLVVELEIVNKKSIMHFA